MTQVINSKSSDFKPSTQARSHAFPFNLMSTFLVSWATQGGGLGSRATWEGLSPRSLVSGLGHACSLPFWKGQGVVGGRGRKKMLLGHLLGAKQYVNTLYTLSYLILTKLCEAGPHFTEQENEA